jgi:hypothetical protein
MKKIFILCFFFFVAAFSVHSQQIITPKNIDWSTFLHQHDLVWNKITSDYYAGAIMGNGLLGNNIYKEGNDYKFHIGRVDVTENRMPADKYQYRNLYDGARLPIGYFLLKTVGKTVSENMRLNLWNATTTGIITTDKGKISFKSYVHATQNIIVVETNCEGEELNFQWNWMPLKAVSPRLTAGRNDYSQAYFDHPNPNVKIVRKENDYFSVQNLVSGKTYVVAWREIKQKNARRMLITISQETTETEAIAKAKETIDNAMKETPDVLEKSHQEWWHHYYPASFASFGNTKMESFYWIQQYKFACLTRPDKFIIDLQGPWAVEETPWPAVWMNLNIQLTYSPVFTANRAELSNPLWKALNDRLQNLIDNVWVEEWKKDAAIMGRSTSYHLFSPLNPNMENKLLYETGNLTWILFYYYEYCQYLQKEHELLKKFFPLLKRNIAYYEHIRIKRADGKYHLPETGSPEYASAKDCNYDLALLYWGLNTLLELNTKYKLKDLKAASWKDFRDNLTPYPVDPENGYMIGENVNMTSSHRHYSHLLMIYPLRTVNFEQPETMNLIEKSIAHWQSMPQWLQGYSFTGSSSMYATLGDGERAAAQLQKLLNRYIQPNTLYKESGPVIETPLAGVAALQELYLQSWNGKIRVFPAVPSDWQEASFIDFRAEGAFLISASRHQGKTVFIQVISEKSGWCRLQTGMNTANLNVQKIGGGKINFKIIDTVKGVIEMNMKAGDAVQLTDKTLQTAFPKPVQHSETEWNFYGVR